MKTRSHLDSRLQILLSRVAISRRLAIASLLLLLPIALLGYVHVASKIDAIESAQREKVGLDYLAPLGQFMRHMAAHRGLTNVYLRGNRAVMPQIQAATDQIDRTVEQLNAQDARAGKLLKTHERWTELSVAWRSLRAETGRLGPEDSFSRHTALIGRALELNVYVAETSGLVLVARPETYYLIDATVVRGAALAEKIGHLRGSVSGLVQARVISAAARIDIARQVAVVSEDFESFERSLAVVYRYAPTLKGEIGPSVATTEIKLHRFLGYMEQLSRGEPLVLTAPELFDSGTDALNEYNRVKDITDAIFRRTLDRVVANLVRENVMTVTFIVATVLVAFLLAFVSTRSVVGPIVHLTRVVDRLATGDKQARARLTLGGEIGHLACQFDKMLDEQQQSEARIRYLATHDDLTKLPNRTMFSELLERTIRSGQRYKRPFALMLIDLDRFKVINDSLGHEAGDILLCEMATRFANAVRESDVVARLGGDEFVVLIQETSNPEQAATVARKLLSAAMKPITILGQEWRVTASIGVCLYPQDGHTEQGLMKNADVAMYQAKEEGKNNFQFYSEKIQVQSLERLTLENQLRSAFEQDQFLLHYQAKVDLTTQRVNGVEALVRWQHPELGMVPPLRFIPIAEETGLIVPLGKWVLRTACRQQMVWRRAGLPAVCMAVNLSPRQFLDPNLLDELAAILRETGMDPADLELEITEGMVTQNVDRAVALLSAIRQMGVRLAVDDFGTGYSSLAQLKRFPINTLKIDRSFIRELPSNNEDRAITEAIIAMGKTLSLTVVAEGVETQEQVAFLRQADCDEMQGYFFSKPVAAEQFAELLRDNHRARQRG